MAAGRGGVAQKLLSLIDSFQMGPGQNRAMAEVPEFPPIINIHGKVYGICGNMYGVCSTHAWYVGTHVWYVGNMCVFKCALQNAWYSCHFCKRLS